MPSAIVGVLVGVNTAWLQTIFTTLVQLHVRPDMRGRITSTYMALALGMQQAGGLQAGILAEMVGIATALRISALVSLVCAAAALWRRPRLGDAPSTPPGLLESVPRPLHVGTEDAALSATRPSAH
jgi:MFS family permease